MSYSLAWRILKIIFFPFHIVGSHLLPGNTSLHMQAKSLACWKFVTLQTLLCIKPELLHLADELLIVVGWLGRENQFSSNVLSLDLPRKEKYILVLWGDEGEARIRRFEGGWQSRVKAGLWKKQVAPRVL